MPADSREEEAATPHLAPRPPACLRHGRQNWPFSLFPRSLCGCFRRAAPQIPFKPPAEAVLSLSAPAGGILFAEIGRTMVSPIVSRRQTVKRAGNSRRGKPRPDCRRATAPPLRGRRPRRRGSRRRGHGEPSGSQHGRAGRTISSIATAMRLALLLEGKPLEGLWFDRTKEYSARRRAKPSSAGQPFSSSSRKRMAS